MKIRALIAALAFFASAFAAYGQNPGNVSDHAFAIGQGPTKSGFRSLLCASAQLAVGQAAADPICRTISGDATLSAAGAVTLATVNAGVGTFGSASQCIVATVNAKGLITAVSQVACVPTAVPLANITGLGTGVQTALGINVGSAGAPVLFNGAGGTPSSLTLTNATGLPIAGITGLGTGVGAALAVNIGSAGAPVLFNGAGGTPSSMTGTNITGVPISTGVSGLGSGCATWLGTPSSANLRTCLTDESGTGVAYFQGGDLGTPSAGVATNITALNATQLTTGTVPGARLPLRALTQGTNQNPTATIATGTGVMMGLGTTCALTTTYSTRVRVVFTGNWTNSGANNITEGGVRFGTGTAPTNGAAQTGTAIGAAKDYQPSTASNVSVFSMGGIVTGLSLATAYWFDISALVSAGTGTLTKVDCSIEEL